ncbi:MAG TPA: hypothetical protein VFQ84_13205 [Arenimonas sp.]|uniref:hypothetical protein n=1 Tax=Arenimonas sp. TaxID=1872635 RepID=UPI002D7F2207|nr:hypothetical protein [Arenimonas sp.]HEU0154289.1 hypothetical protein [Arenimonas sp.]
MDILSMHACTQVAGGDGESSGGGGSGSGPTPVEEAIGEALGSALHDLSSKEALVGAVLSPVGVIIGAVIHHHNNH